jgi:tetratricopeptide (TPR) repeat protein
MESPQRRSAEAQRRNYSEDEVNDMYMLGKLFLETGQHKRAEAIMAGLNEVAPDFAPAWLGTAFLRSVAGNYDGALSAANNALRIDPESAESMLYVVAISLTMGDAATAGTYLGEVGEAIDQGKVRNQGANRFYKMQLARYQVRGK